MLSIVHILVAFIIILSCKSTDEFDRICGDHLFCLDDLPPPQYECDCGVGKRSSVLTYDDIQTLRDELRDLMDNSTMFPPKADVHMRQPLMATWIRLSFHDCAGGITERTHFPSKYNPHKELSETGSIAAICDGCFNPLNPEHSGLDDAVAVLENVYKYSENKWFTKMSRADLWSLAATLAIEYGVDLDSENDETQKILPEIGYFCGRKDCFSAPFSNMDFEFPEAQVPCLDEFVNFMKYRFGFDKIDFSAIIGAHTVGRMHTEFSGFLGPWVDTDPADGPIIDETNIFNNNYYKRLVNRIWFQTFTEANNKWQWHNDNGAFNITMINVDMVLDRDICTGGIHDTGKQTICGDNNKNCGLADTEVRAEVQKYVDSNNFWLEVFTDVFRTMITTGYEKHELCRVGNKNTDPYTYSAKTANSPKTANNKYHSNSDFYAKYSFIFISVFLFFNILFIGYYMVKYFSSKSIKTIPV